MSGSIATASTKLPQPGGKSEFRRPLMIALLLFACAPEAPLPSSSEAPTWSSDVREIVHARCAACHSAGGAGHFPLDTYDAMAPLASAALAAMESGAMPPWPPDPDCRTYEHERRLADGELETFRAWVEAGAPRGASTDDAPFVPPDSTFAPTASASVPAYVPSAAATDDWRCFALWELTSPATRYIHGTQVVPSNALVHHVLVYAVPASETEALLEADEADEGPGYTCFGGPFPSTGESGERPGAGGLSAGFPNQIAGWVPGAEPALYPDDVSVRVDAGSIIVMQVHYNTLAGAPVPDTTTLELDVDEEPTALLSVTRPIAIVDLDIPAGDAEVTFTRAYPNYGEAIELSTVMAHMHMLATRQTVSVQHADATETCLLDIPDWDFDWQQTYTLVDTVTVEPGAAVELSCTYDNSAANQPEVNGQPQEPRDVAWGESSLDEMCLTYYTKLEAWSEPEDPDAPACAGVEACACGPTPTLDCLLSCPESDFGCFTCTIEGAIDCGASSCAPVLAAARDCFALCAGAAVMLDGNVGACLEDQCPEDYLAIQSCLDPILSSGSCDEMLASCGVE
jgi:mono/diheme cytochrome c family protein